MFYLTTHSTHFIYGYMVSDIIMVKNHLDSEKGNPTAPTWAILSDLQQGFFYMLGQDSTYHTACYTSRGALAGTRKVWSKVHCNTL